jgi:hypothetical protein
VVATWLLAHAADITLELFDTQAVASRRSRTELGLRASTRPASLAPSPHRARTSSATAIPRAKTCTESRSCADARAIAVAATGVNVVIPTGPSGAVQRAVTRRDNDVGALVVYGLRWTALDVKGR